MVGAVRFELTTSCTPSKRAYQATLRPEPFAGLLQRRKHYAARAFTSQPKNHMLQFQARAVRI